MISGKYIHAVELSELNVAQDPLEGINSKADSVESSTNFKCDQENMDIKYRVFVDVSQRNRFY